MAVAMDMLVTLPERKNKDGTCGYDDTLHEQNDNRCDYDRKIAAEVITTVVIF